MPDPVPRRPLVAARDQATATRFRRQLAGLGVDVVVSDSVIPGHLFVVDTTALLRALRRRGVILAPMIEGPVSDVKITCPACRTPSRPNSCPADCWCTCHQPPR